MQFFPSAVLAAYIKNYTIVTIDKDLDNEVFYPSGYVDMVINISSGSAATIINGRRKDTPAIELLGHLTLPTRLTVTKGVMVLIARIYPHAAALFFSNPLSEFTNYATDMQDISSNQFAELHDHLMCANTMREKIDVLEAYFLQQIKKNEKRLKKVTILQQLCRNLFYNYESFDLSALANQSGMSERYIQKLYIENVGISPAAFVSVTRFNKSLQAVLSTQTSLTSIAYEYGYYDQAHFIKEFKKFTGITPFDARQSLARNDEAFQQAVNVGF